MFYLHLSFGNSVHLNSGGVEKVPEFNDPLCWNSKKLEKVPNLINEGEVGKLQKYPSSTVPALSNGKY